ncbi:hypothetical protein SEA_PONS_34 [Gordonia phage Pons]|uniref:Uncharacterized protein n=1 Tax=Gordonia phage Pons TaxID=2885976 RepID=A0AAE8Y624_9CAUD|nr:hypothetical protein PP992_gp34 [Gordonia phage Pons]UDL15194.1 hypothetical protein SEA_PONS_34 [Gordonia phage Pons]
MLDPQPTPKEHIMSNTHIPAIGDDFSYEVIVSHADYWFKQGREAGHRSLGLNKGRECSPGLRNRTCTKCFDQWETRTAKVVDVQMFMDNSTEVVLDNGVRRTVVAPHGDACF